VSNTSKDQRADVADQFMDAAGVPMGETSFGEDLNDALTGQEENVVMGTVLGALGDALADDDDGVDDSTIQLAEVYASVAKRIGREAEAQGHIDVTKTNDTTADELDQAGAPVLADMVRNARAAAQP